MSLNHSWFSFRRVAYPLLDWDSMTRFAFLVLALSYGACSSNQSTVENPSAQNLTGMSQPAAADSTQSSVAADRSTAQEKGVRNHDTSSPQDSRWQPYFGIAPLDQAIKAFHAGKNSEAARLFESYIRDKEEGPRILPARFLSLLAWHDAGVTDPTASDLEALAQTWPLLSDYAFFYAGSCHLRAGRIKEALSALGKVTSASSLYSRALEKRARTLANSDRLDEAVTLLKRLISKEKRGRQESWLLQAELLKRHGFPNASRRSAVEVIVRNPLSKSARQAKSFLGLGDGLSAKDQLRLGKAFQKQQMHPKALAALKDAAKRYPRASKERCDALLGIGKTYEKMKKHKKAWAFYNRALGCQGEARALATFWGGKNRLRTGQLEESHRLLKLHLDEFPHRSTADDAAILLAEVEQRRSNQATAERYLFESIQNYPKGDMADETIWALLWPLIKERKFRAADRMAQRLLRISRRETRSGTEGRLGYWAGWIFLKRKKIKEAEIQFKQVITDYPLSWYSLLAYSRLSHIDPKQAKAFLTECTTTHTVAEGNLGDEPAVMETDDHFLKSREMSRMGLHRSAKRELDFISKKKPVEARRWAKARLFSRGSFYARASGLARPAVKRLNRFWPTGKSTELWKMAYPKAFEEDVLRWSQERDIDPYWVWSIMRTESNFNPTVTSWAGAHGLMQIILPTAKNLARGTKIKATKSALRDPKISIQLGTKFLSKLKRRHPHLACASAAYNAGSGAMRKWRRAMGKYPIDEFVERMPYQEARRYAKKVLSTIAVYRWVYDKETTLVSLTPPGTP
jgi:soluble lytic murein transglycosylase